MGDKAFCFISVGHRKQTNRSSIRTVGAVGDLRNSVLLTRREFADAPRGRELANAL